LCLRALVATKIRRWIQGDFTRLKSTSKCCKMRI